MISIMKNLITIPLVLLIISLMLNIILTALLALTYSSLTEEQIVATLKFQKLQNQQQVYTAHIYDNKGSKIGDYKIYGDQWRIDASFIKMKYWANIFGVDSQYTLNRLEGRYNKIEDENNLKHQAYQLESHDLSDAFSFFIDTTYGSSTYSDIKPNTEYTVLKSQTGLIIREKYIK